MEKFYTNNWLIKHFFTEKKYSMHADHFHLMAEADFNAIQCVRKNHDALVYKYSTS